MNEEEDFGTENQSLVERAFLGVEIEADGVEESGIDGEECSEDGEEARVPKIRRAPRSPTLLKREQREKCIFRTVTGAGIVFGELEKRHLIGGMVSRQRMRRGTRFRGWSSIITS